jgi:Carbohydrate family 9 binding domain-like
MRNARAKSFVFALLTGIALTGCVGGSSDTQSSSPAEDKARLKAYVLPKAPDQMPIKLNINFDGKVTLLGAKVEPSGVVRPGGHVKVTMYWRSDKKLDDGWNLFTHVLDGSGERILNIDNVGPLREWKGDRQALAPSLWDPGKVYVDEQDFTVPPTVKTNKVQFTTGIWHDNDRLKIVSGAADRENRGIVANISTGGAAATQATDVVNTRTPALRVDKLGKGVKITLDGKLDEEAWRSAPNTGPLVDVSTGKPNPAFPVGGNVKVLWDDQNLYLGFDVRDQNVIGGFDDKAKDPHLWTKDTVEVMVDPDGDGDNKSYYEIQVNPQGLVFDSQFDDYNLPKKDPDGPFGHQEWDSKLKSGVVVNGTLDKPGDKDQGYVVEIGIPWKSFGKAKQTPPKVGDIWRLNFYAMKENNGAAWSPILGQGNFHKASRFGRVLFGEEGYAPPIPFVGAQPAPQLTAMPRGPAIPRPGRPGRPGSMVPFPRSVGMPRLTVPTGPKK